METFPETGRRSGNDAKKSEYRFIQKNRIKDRKDGINKNAVSVKEKSKNCAMCIQKDRNKAINVKRNL